MNPDQKQTGIDDEAAFAAFTQGLSKATVTERKIQRAAKDSQRRAPMIRLALVAIVVGACAGFAAIISRRYSVSESIEIVLAAIVGGVLLAFAGMAVVMLLIMRIGTQFLRSPRSMLFADLDDKGELFDPLPVAFPVGMLGSIAGATISSGIAVHLIIGPLPDVVLFWPSLVGSLLGAAVGGISLVVISLRARTQHESANR